MGSTHNQQWKGQPWLGSTQGTRAYKAKGHGLDFHKLKAPQSGIAKVRWGVALGLVHPKETSQDFKGKCKTLSMFFKKLKTQQQKEPKVLRKHRRGFLA